MSQTWFAAIVIAFGGAIGCTFILAASMHASAELRGDADRNLFAPLLGGLAIFFGVAAAIWALGIAIPMRHLLFGMLLVFVAGFWGDLTQNRAASLVGQALAILFAAAGANLEVRTLDFIDVTMPGLGLALAVVAVFAVMRAINAMADLPGFRASFSFLALTWFVFAAALSGQDLLFKASLALQAAIGGYLVCNFVLLGKPYRHVFLGGGGGMMVAFAIGWLALELTQGPARLLPAYVALWVLYLPLADGLSVLLRRIARREDLFERSDRHLHHFLKLHGLKTGGVFLLLVAAMGLCGLFGFIGWKRGFPPVVMYGVALALFVAYHVWITRAWKRVGGYVVFTQ